MSVGPSHDAKFHESVPPSYNQQAPHPNSNIQGVYYHPTSHPTIISERDQPMRCNCPNCHQSILTRIEKKNGTIIWLFAAFLFVIGLFLGCCLIPFFIDSLKDRIHYCPNCNTIISRDKIL